jgi:hypothetical protein
MDRAAQRQVLPTDARAPGKFRMIMVEKAEGSLARLSAVLLDSTCTVFLLSVSHFFFFHFLPTFINAALFSTYAS